MSETFWESEAAVEAPAELEPLVETEPVANTGIEKAAAEAEARALTVSTDDFAALEERVLRAVGLVKQERQAHAAAEERAAKAETALREQALRVEQMQAELAAMGAERDQVRVRVERLLSQLDGLEL